MKRSEAVKMRRHIETAVQSLPESAALEVIGLYPAWQPGQAYEAGTRLRCGGMLYHVVQTHTSQETWIPGKGTESLYVRVVEGHAGTADDPIPYDGNMALTGGLYYTQDGTVYLCVRDTGTAVYHALADLTGTYVEAV